MSEHLAAWVPMSNDMIEDVRVLDEIVADMQAGLALAWEDMLHGPRLGPGRGELWHITRPARRAAALRRELDRMGRAAGPYVSRTRNSARPDPRGDQAGRASAPEGGTERS